MSATEAIKATRAAGVIVDLDGDDLALRASAQPPVAVVEALTSNKAEIVALLRSAADRWSIEDWQVFYDERAGILQFDGGLPRPEAEARAFEDCVIEWLNRNPVALTPDRCLWCGQFESNSASIVPFGTEPGGHAWLHGECWRPWNAARRAEAVKALDITLALPDAKPSE